MGRKDPIIGLTVSVLGAVGGMVASGIENAKREKKKQERIELARQRMQAKIEKERIRQQKLMERADKEREKAELRLEKQRIALEKRCEREAERREKEERLQQFGMERRFLRAGEDAYKKRCLEREKIVNDFIKSMFK